MATVDEVHEREQLRLAVRATGRRRGRLQRRLAEIDADLAEVIVRADNAGVPKLTLAKESGLSRQTIYNILEVKS